MRQAIRLGYGIKIGFVLWRLVNVVAGLVLMSALGHGLMGQYLMASVLVAGVLGLYGLLAWLLQPRRRR